MLLVLKNMCRIPFCAAKVNEGARLGPSGGMQRLSPEDDACAIQREIGTDLRAGEHRRGQRQKDTHLGLGDESKGPGNCIVV